MMNISVKEQTAKIDIDRELLDRELFENRIIDLVFLCAQTMGDPELELEILRLFSKTSSDCLSVILSDTTESEIKLALHSLKGAASNVGAKSIAQNINIAENFMQENGFIEREMLSNIGFSVEEARRFIKKIISE